MAEGYFDQYAKTNLKLFPFIRSRNNPDPTFGKLRQQTEQSLMMEIQDINASLKDKAFTVHQGNLFSSEITDKVISGLVTYIKKPTIIMEDGFSLWQNNLINETVTLSQNKRLTAKLETFNERLVNLSLNNAFNYDMKKYNQIAKINRQRWCLLKKVNDNSMAEKTSLSKISESLSPGQTKKISHSDASIKDSTFSTMKNQGKGKPASSQKSNFSTVNPLSKMKSIKESSNVSHIKALPFNNDSFHKLLTEVKQFSNPQQEAPLISKHDIRTMLRKEGQRLVFIWIPPLTYPQLYGMFTYVEYKRMPVCRLKKYFFVKRSLSVRFFNSIIEQISAREGKIIEGLEIVASRADYIRVYEPIGWKMKAMEANDKIRIRYIRQIK